VKTVGVDVPYITRLAKNSAYNWMGSLRPLRIHLLRSTPKRRCAACRQPLPKLSDDLVNTITTSMRFRSDLIELKKRLRADRLIVSVGPLRLSI
jgi:hypothetical protein